MRTCRMCGSGHVCGALCDKCLDLFIDLRRVNEEENAMQEDDVYECERESKCEEM
jgi:hypothetical protein